MGLKERGRKKEAILSDDVERFLGEKIGEGLVRLGEMTPEGVEKVLECQRAGDGRLFGEIAMDLGLVDLMAVIRYMESGR
ncbi:MAG: hypothetical protein LBQ61_02390 [Spirochaetales bacterium]|jgi:hypothetical protein|nr:hypothetical protein [Spirochaetales bacterium]